MEKRTLYQRVAEFQQRIKESPAFLLVATAALLVNGYAHYRWGWDPDWGATNFALSVEALYNGIFVLMAFAVTSKLAKEFQAWLRHQIVEVRKLLQRIEAILEVLQVVLAHIEEIRAVLPLILKHVQTQSPEAP